MCSWFCETFCCFLLRCRDSSTQNTSTTSNNPSSGAEFNNHNRPSDLNNAKNLSTIPPDSARREVVENDQPRSRPTMLLGNSWQQELDKPLPPMIPELKSTDLNLVSDQNGRGLVMQGRGDSESFVGQHRLDESLGDVGLYSVRVALILDRGPHRHTSLYEIQCIEPVLMFLKSSVLMKVAAAARTPGIFKSQPPTPTTAAPTSFRVQQSKESAQSVSPEHSPDISPRTVRSSVSTYVEPTIKISKFYSSSVARPFSGRTNFSGSTHRE
ncbi:hypothetical protein MMC13_007700 [Lambiella insularis]|nr:hypothetical protein [Lambiella insularis]